MVEPFVSRAEIVKSIQEDDQLSMLKNEIETNGDFNKEKIKMYKYLRNQLSTTSDGIILVDS